MIIWLGWVVALAVALYALSAHGGRRRLTTRRAGPAILALLAALALAGVLGWKSAPSTHRQVYNAAGPVVTADASDVPEPIANALRANVLILCIEQGWCGRACLGSGVIVSIKDNTALILTNRHVVDPTYGDEQPRWGAPAPPELSVFAYECERVDAKVVWLHPEGLDIAMVECKLSSTDGLAAARWCLPAAAPVGGDVFAIGNPLGLGWTYTHGKISGIRQMEGCRTIQTDTAINPGNSGGGLYNADGILLGINTWGVDKSVAESLNFAIAIETAAEVLKPLMPDESANALR